MGLVVRRGWFGLWLLPGLVGACAVDPANDAPGASGGRGSAVHVDTGDGAGGAAAGSGAVGPGVGGSGAVDGSAAGVAPGWDAGQLGAADAGFDAGAGEPAEPAEPAEWYPCDGDPGDYEVAAIERDGVWTVSRGADVLSTTADMATAMLAAYAGLTPGRIAKERVLIRGSGEVSADVQLRIPGQTVVNVCGTIHVVGTAGGSDRSPLYARGVSGIDIPHVRITGGPQYGMFFRSVTDLHLGKVELVLDVERSGLGIRIDNNPQGGGARVTGIELDDVYVEGSGGHGVETYGVDGLVVGELRGRRTGNCGLLLNDTVNADVGAVDCEDCAHVGTGYAAFRIANGAGRIGDRWPAGNIHVGSVDARGGGRGIFCVSGSGGLTVDRFDIDRVGGAPAVFIENCQDITLAADAGRLTGGELYIGYNAGNGAPSSDVLLQRIALQDAKVRELCLPEGDLGNRARDITGGDVAMCFSD